MNFSSEDASGVDAERDCCEVESDCCELESVCVGGDDDVGEVEEESLPFCVVVVVEVCDCGCDCWDLVIGILDDGELQELRELVEESALVFR